MNHNQTIYVFAPANSMRDLPDHAVDIGIKKLHDLGFNVLFAKNIHNHHHDTPGTIVERYEDIEAGLEDDAVAIMMAVYGGHNTNQLIEALDYALVKKANKLFVGYSDISILLNAIWAKSAVKSIHGPSFASFCDPNIRQEVVNSFLQLVTGQSPIEYTTPSFAAADLWYLKQELGPRDIYPHPPWYALREGTAMGQLVGGNLDSFTSLIGTPYLPELSGCILLIESSIHEDPGRFDRQMTYLRHANIYSKISGLIVGQFSPTSLLSQIKVIKEMIDRVTYPHQFPVMINGSFSHVDPILSLPIGGHIKLHAYGDQCKITIMDPL